MGIKKPPRRVAEIGMGYYLLLIISPIPALLKIATPARLFKTRSARFDLDIGNY
jgi:hypothetical protein